MKVPLGSRERPLPIRQICCYGDSSTRMRPGLAKVLLQTDRLPPEVTNDWTFEVPVRERKVWVRLQPCGFRPRGEQPERFVSPQAMREPGVLITAFKPGTLGAEYYAKSPLHRESFEERKHAGRVHYLNQPVMNALTVASESYASRPEKKGALEEWRADLMKHIESELGRDG